MIPTPNLAYLAILPAVDNLATPHGEFSAIRLYIIFRRFIFRNSRKVNAIFCQGFYLHTYCLTRNMFAYCFLFG